MPQVSFFSNHKPIHFRLRKTENKLIAYLKSHTYMMRTIRVEENEKYLCRKYPQNNLDYNLKDLYSLMDTDHRHACSSPI